MEESWSVYGRSPFYCCEVGEAEKSVKLLKECKDVVAKIIDRISINDV